MAKEGKGMIAVVDYCKGNLKSVERGLMAVGGDARIVADPGDIARADAVVLPGVGAFADASATMLSNGQMDAVRAALSQGKPFLGICLGEHLMFEGGIEGAGPEGVDGDAAAGTVAQGLGVLPGIVGRMAAHDDRGRAYKVPHVGWNSVEFDSATAGPLFAGIDPGEYFYFTHSYCAPACAEARAWTAHAQTFPCVVQAGERAWGVQFHPEKSSDAGARLLRNFVEMAALR